VPPADPPPGAAPGPDAAPGPEAAAPGLREQIGATRDAVKRLVGAHVELGKAEIGDVADEIKRVAIFAGIAIAVALAAGLLVSIGLPLFLGEWIFGSIGWGLLDGLLLLTAIGIAAVLLALRISPARIGRSLAGGAIVGILVGLALGLNATNNGWRLLGDQILPLAESGVRPLATALVVLPIVGGLLFGVLGLIQVLGSEEARTAVSRPTIAARIAVSIPTSLYVGWLAMFLFAYQRGVAWFDWGLLLVGVAAFAVSVAIVAVLGHWRPFYAFATEVAIGVVLGTVLGAFTAIGFGRRVGAAVGVAAGLIAWSGLMGADVAASGVDFEGLKKRFIPQNTIDITKETIEWARARMPLSRRS
jgi:hypothetical protein